MKDSISELIAEKYYRLKKWFVERDVPFLPPEGKNNWSDLDILAVGEEVHLVNCKDYLPDNKNIYNVIKNLEQSEIYIRKEYNHIEGKAFKKIYIYGGTSPVALKQAQDKGIITIQLNELFLKYIKLLDKNISNKNVGRKDIAIGKRYYIIGEHDGVDKYTSFLLNNDYINTEVINKQLREINFEGLSLPYKGKI